MEITLIPSKSLYGQPPLKFLKYNSNHLQQELPRERKVFLHHRIVTGYYKVIEYGFQSPMFLQEVTHFGI